MEIAEGVRGEAEDGRAPKRAQGTEASANAKLYFTVVYGGLADLEQ